MAEGDIIVPQENDGGTYSEIVLLDSGISIQGIQGTQGGQGMAGSSQGLQGIQGIQGAGTVGTQGIQGPAGSAQGTQGIQGNIGTGTQGTQGTAGSAQGTQGIQGTTGTGTQGTQGMAGSSQGTQGIQGTTGTGTQGTQGTIGTSVQGTQGIQGKNGVGTPGGSSGDIQYNNSGAFGGFGDWNNSTEVLAITGSVAVSSEIYTTTAHPVSLLSGGEIKMTNMSEPSAPIASKGLIYISGTAGSEKIYFKNNSATYDLTASAVQGTQGTTGAQGAAGSGTQGTVGSQGTTGTGTQGTQGPSGTSIQGTQGTIGTSVQGTQGPAGAQGTIGAQGAAGSGTQGTVGSQGAVGSQGIQGTSGASTGWVLSGDIIKLNDLHDSVELGGTNSGLNKLYVNNYGDSISTLLSAFNNTVNGTAIDGDAGNITGTIGVKARGGSYDFYAYGSGTDYGTSSSIRWKKNIHEIPDALKKLNSLRGVYFDWDEEHGGKHSIGFIAEEIGKILPEIVVYEDNGIDANGMAYARITPLLLQAIKELYAEVKKLKHNQST